MHVSTAQTSASSSARTAQRGRADGPADGFSDLVTLAMRRLADGGEGTATSASKREDDDRIDLREKVELPFEAGTSADEIAATLGRYRRLGE